MDPFSGQRWSTITPERIAWHAFTVGVLALLLVVLLVSVEILGDARAVGSPAPVQSASPGSDRPDASDGTPWHSSRSVPVSIRPSPGERGGAGAGAAA